MLCFKLSSIEAQILGAVWLLHNLEEAFERHGTIGYIDENEGGN